MCVFVCFCVCVFVSLVSSTCYVTTNAAGGCVYKMEGVLCGGRDSDRAISQSSEVKRLINISCSCERTIALGCVISGEA